MKHTEYRINAAQCRNFEELFDQVSRCFEFPDYFGRNFNALNECLLDKIEESDEIMKFVLFETSKFLCEEPDSKRDLFLEAFVAPFLNAMLEFPGKVTIHVE